MKGNYSQMTVDGVLVTLQSAEPWPYEKGPYGKRWYQVIGDVGRGVEELGRVIRCCPNNNRWTVDPDMVGRHDGREFRSRSAAVVEIVRHAASR